MFAKHVGVIDLFAGPGGLGEGFSQFHSKNVFGPSVSIEMDPIACDTLRLRKLFHCLKSNDKKRYYELVKSDEKITWENLKETFKDYAEYIEDSVWNHELGSDQHDEKTTNDEIRRRLKKLGHTKDKPLVIIGGPPCQAYSLIGRASRKQMSLKGNYVPEKDNRHFLYQWYLNIIPEFKPDAFVMENVPGILSSKVNDKPIFKQILKDLRGLGYELFSLKENRQLDLFDQDLDFKLKASDYGVAQDRQRVIVLGLKEDIATAKKISCLTQKETNTVESLLSEMPKLRSGLSKVEKTKTKDSLENWKEHLRQKYWEGFKGIEADIKKELKKSIKKIQDNKYSCDRGGKYIPCAKYGYSNRISSELSDWYVDENVGGYLNHESRSHMDCDLRRYLFNSVFTSVRGRSPLLNDYPPFLQPDHKNKHAGNHKDRFRTIRGSSPSKTITSHISKDGHAFIHPDPIQCRSLTVREAARIQSFPDNYFFCGNRTQQYHQVGNAVPPYLAYQIAEVVHKILDEEN